MNAVEIQGVSQRYGSMTVLHDLNLNLGEGEVLGLFGHNGAGKTTSMKLILGLLAPSEGQVKVLGRAPNDPQVRRQLGYLPENVTFYPQLSGRETLRHFARLKGAALSQVDELLEQVGLAHAADRRVKTYSKGMRQRLGLAQALLGEPKLLLLDEPFSAVDQMSRQGLYRLLADLRSDLDIPILLVTHDLNEARLLADRLVVMDAGTVLQEGPPEHIHRAPRNARVADLVGMHNRFQGVWVGPSDRAGWGLLKWVSAAGEESGDMLLEVRDKGKIKPGQPVNWVVPGDGILLGADGSGQELEATVSEARHLGEITLASLTLERNPQISLRITLAGPQRRRIGNGDRLALRLDPALVHVMPLHQRPPGLSPD